MMHRAPLEAETAELRSALYPVTSLPSLRRESGRTAASGCAARPGLGKDSYTGDLQELLEVLFHVTI